MCRRRCLLGEGSVGGVDGEKIEFRRAKLGRCRDLRSIAILEGSVFASFFRPEGLYTNSTRQVRVPGNRKGLTGVILDYQVHRITDYVMRGETLKSMTLGLRRLRQKRIRARLADQWQGLLLHAFAL